VLDAKFSVPDKIINKSIATKFHYTKVPNEEDGLTDEMIILLDDRTLNQYLPLKKLAPYRDNYQLNQYKKKQMMTGLQKELERKKVNINYFYFFLIIIEGIK
jgi:protein KRI1